MITYTLRTDITSPTAYTVRFEVINAVGIELDIFVFDTQYDAYLNVATPYDMRHWPASRAEAITAGLTQYRARGVLRTLTGVAAADTFVAVTRERISSLDTQWALVTDGYIQDQIYTVPAE